VLAGWRGILEAANQLTQTTSGLAEPTSHRPSPTPSHSRLPRAAGHVASILPSPPAPPPSDRADTLRLPYVTEPPPIPAAGTTTPRATPHEHERRCALLHASSNVAHPLLPSGDGSTLTPPPRCFHRRRYARLRPRPPSPGPFSRVSMRRHHLSQFSPRPSRHIATRCGVHALPIWARRQRAS
jgi:hypothetical protein